MLHLYTDASPNGYKVSIALEELQLPYQLHHIRIDAGEHRQPAFLALNPHGRIPVLVDDVAGITLFESAAILLYLAEHSGRLLPTGPARWQAIQWLQFHASSMGPLLGQRVHYQLLATPSLPAVSARFIALTEATFATLDAHLRTHTWLAGAAYSIADIATFGWTHIATVCGFDFSPFVHLSAWHARMAARPAVQRGIQIPEVAHGP
ncbi:glutathione S-transferase family protein [Stenotrophomonas rhizophila]|uniref:glutathione S-transferase family protein n=1 Tax=Stenotrophomonas rhizophila TaxID=216778 RepID=UPI001E64222D|nr:glutathione S-transferase family protein [Stenotrophomonas rhizophila]MCC7632925.1 glutathione S-transferase family protein [Stenotrophomonas rhizophila]MCC7662350.1 glutathione S-transferase family protein [Stenotrophomonas rhizophila]